MDVFDVLGMGSILAGAEDAGLVVTANRVYLNLWCRSGSVWVNTDVRHLPSRIGDREIADVPLREIEDLAEAWLAELR